MARRPRRARAGAASSPLASTESFDEVYHERFEPMVRLACGFVDRRAVAEDIVQDSFRQLWQRWDSVVAPGSYLRTSVVNGCHNELRRRRVRRDSAHKLIDGPEADAVYLADALADIPESRRKALVLRFYGGRTMSEIAEAMDIPTGTAKSLIHRGLADLRGALN
ncbi:MAG: sigma-70 family RNA polymerase sigma factor [Actinomycetia bacterium]|nr:sigma-70 family RNA polymerase sigma factor [Actinomycetes bacterium]MCP5033483.1 sigma-70 family RNA polymerase sigma factor [Actinomycetes bacterium]